MSRGDRIYLYYQFLCFLSNPEDANWHLWNTIEAYILLTEPSKLPLGSWVESTFWPKILSSHKQPWTLLPLFSYIGTTQHIYSDADGEDYFSQGIWLYYISGEVGTFMQTSHEVTLVFSLFPFHSNPPLIFTFSETLKKQTFCLFLWE